MKKNNRILLFILILISFLTFYRLFRPGYFSMMDDMHIFRLQQFDQCLKDAQIPCRYIKDGGMGYGYPLFNYYPPLSYLISQFFHLIGFSLINSLKITFALSHPIGAVGMFLFTYLFWGKFGAFISAVVFLFAPYQATDSWVRGAIAESLSINIIPWVFFFLTKFIKNKLKINNYFIFLVFSLTALLLSHNLISLAISPILVIFSIFLIIKNNNFNFKSLLKLTLPVLFSLGISSFYLFPAIFEKNLVTIETMTQSYFNYIIHFATLNQLFISRFWGFGASLWGPVDDMSFSVGLIHWLLPLISIILLFFKKKKKHFCLSIIFFILFLFYTFLTHNKSTFIWQSLPFMAYFQFPWRFLAIVIFIGSFLSGSFVTFLQKKYKKIAVLFITLVVIFLNFSYFKEDIWYSNLTDNEKLSSSELIAQSGAGIKDYWPKFSNNIPTIFALDKPEVVTGEVDFTKYYKKSNYSKAFFSVSSPTAIIKLPIVYFPNWELYLNGQRIDYQIDPDLGLIQFKTNQGENNYELFFKNTPIRIFSNYLSLISLISIIILIFINKYKK